MKETQTAESGGEGTNASASCGCRLDVVWFGGGGANASGPPRSRRVCANDRGSASTARAGRARSRRTARAPFPARVAVAIGCSRPRKNPNRRPTRAPGTRTARPREDDARVAVGGVDRTWCVRASRREDSRASRSSGWRSRVGEASRARTHLASCSVASKRFAGATTANAGAGACSWRAVRCLGATRAVLVSAMHMFGFELGGCVGHGGEARARGCGMDAVDVDAR